MNDVFDDLLNGKFATSEQTLEAVRTLGLSLSILYRIVVVRLHFPPKEYENQTQYKKTLQLFVDGSRRHWKQMFYRIRSDRIIFLLPAEEISHVSYKQRITTSIQSALSSLPTAAMGCHAAIGDACSVTQISDLGEGPLRILQFADGKVNESFVFDNSDLGIYRFLTDITDAGKLLDLVPPPLRELHKHHPVLSDTLRVFLNNQQQLKASASQLCIHPKTIRYRIDRIQEITSINFGDPDEVLKYNLGFRALRLVGDEIP